MIFNTLSGGGTSNMKVETGTITKTSSTSTVNISTNLKSIERFILITTINAYSIAGIITSGNADFNSANTPLFTVTNETTGRCYPYSSIQRSGNNISVDLSLLYNGTYTYYIIGD